MRNDAGPLPILVAALGILVLSVMDGLIKAVAPHYPTAVTVLMRFVFGGIVATALYVLMGMPRPSRETLRFALLRGVFVVLSAGMFFAALGLLPLVEVIALSFLAPIVIAIFGRLFLGEALHRSIFAGIALGTAGLLVMLGEQLFAVGHRAESLLGIALVILSTFTYAASLILLRARAVVDPLPTLVLLQNWIPALYVLPAAGIVWVPPAMDHLWLFVGIGVLGAVGHILLTWAFARASAARLGVVEYTALLWAAGIGYVWFSEAPTLATLAGAALIIAGALAVGWARAPAVAAPASETAAPRRS
jgi:S-adenosylmethionine uptake transporter